MSLTPENSPSKLTIKEDLESSAIGNKHALKIYDNFTLILVAFGELQ